MKQLKSIIGISAIASVLILMYLGTVYGGSVTMQREGAPQGGQESTVAKNNGDMDRNPMKFTPRKQKNKDDSGRESEEGDRPVSFQRYKPYTEGEGEKKVK